MKADCVQKWLANFASNATRKAYAFNIFHFFQWLWVVKEIHMTPEQVLDDQNQRQNQRLVNANVRERVHWSYLAVEFAKDSAMPDEYPSEWKGNKNLGHTTKSQARYAVYSWFAYNDLDLKPVKSIRIEEKEIEELPPFPLEDFAKIAKRAPLKWRCALLVLLHSAVRIGDLFDQVGLMWPTIKEQIAKKTCIIKVSVKGMEIFHEVPWSDIGTKLVCLRLYGSTTRGKIFHYICFLGKDALDALVQYVKERGEPAKDERLWDCDKTRLQKGITVWAVQEHLMQRDKSNTKGGRKYPYYVHRIRKIFKTTCMSHGIREADGEFWSGHKRTGVDKIYDERHISHPSVFAAEYLKAEYLFNVLSNPSGQMNPMTAEFIQRFEQDAVDKRANNGNRKLKRTHK